MSSTGSIIPLFVLCGTVLGAKDLLPPVMEVPSMNSTQPVNLTSEGVLMQDIQYFLYTNKNPNVSEQLFYKNHTILYQSSFNFSQPLKIVTHGWRNNYSSPIGIQVRQGFLSHGNFNVIMVNWSKIASQNYIYAANRVRAVGALVGEMIDFLVDLGADPRNISVVGHSLGAHVAGLAALQANANISHVVANPCKNNNGNVNFIPLCISTKDAKYVEIIHTCGGNLGLLRPLGHADFYPNGGGPRQPGCGSDSVGSCAHSRAYEYYADSLINPNAWFAIMCNSSEAFEAGDCSGNDIQPFPRWKADFHKPPGMYQLRTASKAPYGLGMNGTKPALNATLATDETESVRVNESTAKPATTTAAPTVIKAATNKISSAVTSFVKV